MSTDIIQQLPIFKLEDWLIGQKIGKGQSSKVYMVKNTKTGEVYALRVVRIKTYSVSQIRDEISNIQKIAFHPHCSTLISRYYGIYVDNQETPGIIYMVLEYIVGDNLYNYLENNPNTLSQETVMSLVNLLLQALQYLHSNNIVHRDIKLENIIITPFKEIKVIDLGFTCHFSKCMVGTGTLLYMPPEQYIDPKYADRLDIWSLGIVIYELLGYEAYKDIPGRVLHTPEKIEILHQQVKDNLQNNTFQQIVMDCLTPDYHQRPTAEQLLDKYFT